MKEVFEPPRDLHNIVLEQLAALRLANAVESMDSSTLKVFVRSHPDGGHWTMTRFLYDLINAAYREGQKEQSNEDAAAFAERARHGAGEETNA